MVTRWEIDIHHVRKLLLLAFPRAVSRGQLGQQIVRVILEAFGAMMITGVVQGGLFAWLGGWDGGRFSVINWTGSIVVYLLLSESTTFSAP